MRRALRVLLLFVSMGLIMQGLVGLPPRPAALAQAAPPEPLPVTSEPAPGDNQIPPLTDADREPEPAEASINAIEDPNLVPVDFGPGSSPLSLIDDEIPLPEEGGPQSDVYAPGLGVGDHLLVVSADIVNAQDAGGAWVDAPSVPVATDGGWNLEGGDFSVDLPAVLGQDSPIVYTTPYGRIEMTPTGAQGPGVLAGSEVRYVGALPGTDFIYEQTPGGYKESVLLAEGASTGLAWTVRTEGLTLAAGEAGTIEVLVDGELASIMSPPWAKDASSPRRITYPAYVLSESAPGSYSITLDLDASWVAGSVFPITVDPTTTNITGATDTFINSSQPNNGFGTTATLKTGGTSGTQYYTFVKFPTSWEQPGRIVYTADLKLRATAVGTASSPATARRVIDPWVQSITFAEAMPPNPQVTVGAVPAEQTATGAKNTWYTFDLDRFYQGYIDGTWSDQGVRVESSDSKTFSSAQGSDPPYLMVSYNDLPPAPSLNNPATNVVVETTTPTLSIQDLPVDPNGDEVLVRYQVSDLQGDWSSVHLVGGTGGSGWTSDKSFSIPSSWNLNDGAQYFWRVQAADVCIQPADVCSLQKPDGSSASWNSSASRNFTVSRKSWGTDGRYAMWSQEIGNGMQMGVNEANGNLVLEVPLDTLPTPLGPLAVGLSYNSEMADRKAFPDVTWDKGLGDGWRLHAGPGSGSGQLPVLIEEVGWGARISFRSGKQVTFPWRGGRSYRSLAGEGVVTKDGNQGWTYITSGGDYYAFDAQGQLSQAKPVSSRTKSSLAANPYFRYSFDGSGHLQSVTDPLERAITFTWSGGRLQRVDTWDGRQWDLTYLAGQLRSIAIPGNDTVRFSYTDHTTGGVTSSLLTEVENAKQYADEVAQVPNASGWKIDHFFDDGPNADYEVYRVRSLTPPGASPASVWRFDYGSAPADYSAWTSLRTLITDPRGSTSSSIYRTTVDFSTVGLPIQITAPKADGSESTLVSRMRWDSRGQLICSHSAAAEAIQTACTAANPTDQYATDYDYQSDEPYRPVKVTYPAATAGAIREMRTTGYDEGPDYAGLWVQRFENANLAGVPDDEGIWGEGLNHDWGTGKPGALSDPDTWSLRLTGFLDISSWTESARSVRWRVTSDDGAALVVGDDVSMDCIGAVATTPLINCGITGNVKQKIFKPATGLVPIVIEFAEKTGSAKLKVEWSFDQGSTWAVVPLTDLDPNLGLVTSEVSGPDWSGSSTTLQRKITWSYAGDDRKARRLPDSKTRKDLANPTDQFTTTYTYDDYGRRETMTLYSGTSEAATTTREFTDNPNTEITCLTKVTDPLGAVTLYTCDSSGNRTRTTWEIRAKSIGSASWPSETRIEDVTYDPMGRPTLIEHPGPGIEKIAYDPSGRPKKHQLLIAGDGDGGPDDGWAVTDTSYTDYPSSGGPSLLVQAADPDAGGSASRPEVTHLLDWVGNEIARTDELGGTWTTTYDALNRVTSTTTPDPDYGNPLVPLTTTTSYVTGAVSGALDAYVLTTAPGGETTKTKLDVLGRTTSVTDGWMTESTFNSTLASSTTCYDAAGNVSRTEARISGTACTGSNANTHAWSEVDHDSFGRKTEVRAPSADAAGNVTTATTTYSYYASTGRRKTIDGPLVGSVTKKDVVTYTWDLAGRLASTTMWTNTNTDFVTDIYRNDMGQRLRLASDLSADGSSRQKRDFTHTPAGQVSTLTEVHGGSAPDTVTTNHYDVAGNLTSIDDPRGIRLVFVVDGLGRETARCQRASGSCTGSSVDEIATAYDAAGRVTQVDRGTAITYMDLDRIGRPQHITGAGGNTDYGYNSAGRLTSMITSAGTMSYAYFAAGVGGGSLGMLQRVTDPLTGANTSYTYDQAGRVATRDDAAGMLITRTYEPQTSMIDEQTIQEGNLRYARFDIDHDVAGNVTDRVQKLWTAGDDLTDQINPPADVGSGATTYDYDGAGRLLTASGPGPTGISTTWTYAYDGLGNRTSVSDGTETTNTTYDLQGWPVSDDNATPSNATDDTTYSVDPAGNLLGIDAQGSTSDLGFIYDSWGLTTQASAAGVGVTYDLDGLGRTLSRTASATTTSYIYEGLSETLASASDGSTTTTYASTPGGPLGEKTGSNSTFYIRDLHGDTVASIRTNATSLSSSTWYSAFGEPTVLDPSPPALGFQSQITDPATGTVDMTTRMYLPSMGRFTTRDALFGRPKDPMSLNQWAYAEANPVTATDFSGTVDSHHDGPVDPGPVDEDAQEPGDAGDGDIRDDYQMSIDERQTAAAIFFNLYGCQEGPCEIPNRGYGDAYYDFQAWEIESGRLIDSAWWRIVNGKITSSVRAALLYMLGERDHVGRNAAAWVEFARASRGGSSDAQHLFWRAHQISLHTGVRDAMPYYWAEPKSERSVIRMALVNVDLAALQNFASTGGFLGTATAAAYPSAYPPSQLQASVMRHATLLYVGSNATRTEYPGPFSPGRSWVGL